MGMQLIVVKYGMMYDSVRWEQLVRRFRGAFYGGVHWTPALQAIKGEGMGALNMFYPQSAQGLYALTYGIRSLCAWFLSDSKGKLFLWRGLGQGSGATPYLQNSLSMAMCSGVVPQQPPRMRAPAFFSFCIPRANFPGVME